MTRTLVLASVVMAAIPSTSRAVPCADPVLSATAITTADTVIEDGGGIIVAAANNFHAQSTDEDTLRLGNDMRQDLSVRPAWRFRDGDKLVAPTIDKIAPGLAVYRLPSSRSHSYWLESASHKSIVAVRRSAERDASVLGAPVVTAGGSTSFTSRRGSGSFVTIHLVSPPPKGARMMVAYGPNDAARSFAPIVGTGEDVVVWRTRGSCELPIRGEISTAIGDKIRVAWLDESGRLSAKSAPIEIKEEKQK